MKIQKLETGGVLLIDDQDQVIRSMPANVFLQTTDNLVTVYIGDSKVSLFPNSITETQVLPDAPIPFNGDAYDLSKLLSENFFFMSNCNNGGSGANGALSTGTPYLINNTDQSVYADGSQGLSDPNGIDGLYYKNSPFPQDKINWYYLNNATRSSNQTLTTLEGGYAVITIYAAGVCYFNVYTKRKNDGQDVSWYRSRRTYLTYNSFDSFIDQRVVIYWGKEPTVYPDLPRIEMNLDMASTVGPQESDEEIFLSALNTSTNYPGGTYEFTAQSLGYINDGIYHNFPCTFNSDVTALELRVEQLETLSLFLIAADQGRYFRGYVMDAASMNALANPIDYNYVARVDTGTIWRYENGSWVDTNITVSLESIGAMDAEIAGYSNTHYIDLDGTNDYIGYDNGVDAALMDFTQQFSLGIEIENVSSINDNSYTTIFKRGTNEICLRKGGSNWGVYVFANGLSIGQANTWVAPQSGSKILFVFTGTHIKYYLDGIEIPSIAINANVSQNNPVGDLEIGQGGSVGSNWYGGLNNNLLMIGSGSALGSNQLAEYFAGQDVTTMSFYEDVYDFVPLGEKTYPTVSGTKDVVSGNLINGTESDFVER